MLQLELLRLTSYICHIQVVTKFQLSEYHQRTRPQSRWVLPCVTELSVGQWLLLLTPWLMACDNRHIDIRFPQDSESALCGQFQVIVLGDKCTGVKELLNSLRWNVTVDSLKWDLLNSTPNTMHSTAHSVWVKRNAQLTQEKRLSYRGGSIGE